MGHPDTHRDISPTGRKLACARRTCAGDKKNKTKKKKVKLYSHHVHTASWLVVKECDVGAGAGPLCLGVPERAREGGGEGKYRQ